MKLFLIILGCSFLNVKLVYSQKSRPLLPNEIGTCGFVQRTSTMLHSFFQRPYYTTWGVNSGTGIFFQYKIKKKYGLKIWYNYTKLMNTYDISRNSPIFTGRDAKEFKQISYYWKAHEIGINFRYNIYSKKKNTLWVEQSFCTNYGALVYEHFPSGLYETYKRNIKYENGENGELNYIIMDISIRNMGFNYLSGICYQRTLTEKLKLNINLGYNFGLIPLIGTRIDYTITNLDNLNTNGFRGQQYATSNNSGLRLGFGLSYSLKRVIL